MAIDNFISMRSVSGYKARATSQFLGWLLNSVFRKSVFSHLAFTFCVINDCFHQVIMFWSLVQSGRKSPKLENFCVKNVTLSIFPHSNSVVALSYYMKAGRQLFQPPIGFSREIQDKERFEYLLSCMSYLWQSLCLDPYFRLEEV